MWTPVNTGSRIILSNIRYKDAMKLRPNNTHPPMPPGDAELYRRKLRLTRAQRIGVAVYATAGIVGAAAVIAICISGFTEALKGGIVAGIPCILYLPMFMLVLWIGFRIILKSALPRSRSKGHKD